MITLADLAKNSNDKLVQGFVNEVITDSFLLDSLQFDNCVEAGASDLVYGYKRVTAGLTAAFRDIGAEPAVSELQFERVTTRLAILSDKWAMDRVAMAAAPDLYEQYLTESKFQSTRPVRGATPLLYVTARPPPRCIQNTGRNSIHIHSK